MSKTVEEVHFSVEYGKKDKKAMISINRTGTYNGGFTLAQTHMFIDKTEAKRIISLLNRFLKSN